MKCTYKDIENAVFKLAESQNMLETAKLLLHNIGLSETIKTIIYYSFVNDYNVFTQPGQHLDLIKEYCKELKMNEEVKFENSLSNVQIYETNAALGYNQLAFLIKLDKSKNGYNYLCVGSQWIYDDDDSYKIGEIVEDLEDYNVELSNYKIENSPLFHLYENLIKAYEKSKLI
jgi:hypothetical protein